MKKMKREKVDMPLTKRKSVASKKSSVGVIAACIGIMAAVVAKGIQLDREDAASKELTETEDEDGELSR